MGEHIDIFDTTLRDGEQSPGCSLNLQEKLEMARQLERLNVDIIEAGFPIASEGDFEAVRAIASEIRGPIIAALARANEKDIRRAAAALEGAARPRLHTFLATSDIHLQYKLHKTRDQALKQIAEMVALASSLIPGVEFSPEDAGRTDRSYLVEVCQAAVEAGATVLNLPDTVGYCLGPEYEEMFRYVGEKVQGNGRGVILSTHTHNDLGLAAANTLAGIQGGARQVECTINGIGERAGNAALEEIVMALRLRQERLGFETGVRTEELYPSSRLLTRLTGVAVQPNKAIVGQNAFAHEAGIHQDGMLKNSLTYEIMTPASVGAPATAIVLGKHSGRHALAQRFEHLGYSLTKADLDQAYELFTRLADRKKQIYDEDLIEIANRGLEGSSRSYALRRLQIQASNDGAAATVELEHEGEVYRGSASAGDAEDAVLHAIDKAAGVTGALAGELVDFDRKTTGTQAERAAEVTLRVRFSGREFTGRASASRAIEAAARAYLQAVNKASALREPRQALAASASAAHEAPLPALS